MSPETDFIRMLQARFPARPPVTTGIGDDGAVLACDREMVVVTDMLLDGVHFQCASDPVELIGRKAIAVNLSDLAAMACRPTAAFICLALSTSSAAAATFPSQLYDGIARICEEFSVTIAGGDTNSWPGPFAISVCLTGEPFGKQPLLRSGGQPGDILFVTGPLGGSLHHGRHLRFTPKLKAAEWLSGCGAAHALMDVSDGLALDLRRLADASGTGATINAQDIPIHDDVPANRDRDVRLLSALGDGEDFELLLAADASAAGWLERAAAGDGIILHRIGQLDATPGCRMVNFAGRNVELPGVGFQHNLPAG